MRFELSCQDYEVGVIMAQHGDARIVISDLDDRFEIIYEYHRYRCGHGLIGYASSIVEAIQYVESLFA